MASVIQFIADDFGLSEEINRAIVVGHTRGALHGASLMMGQAATGKAVELARANASLQIGWHVHLADSQPCTVAAWPWGHSPVAAGFALGLSTRMRDLARREIRAQWEEFRATGLPCRFVNAHHHLHVHPFVRHVLLETLGDRFDGWVRWGRPRFFGRGPARLGAWGITRALQDRQRTSIPFRTSTTLWGLDRTCAMAAAEIRAVSPQLGDGLHEFMFHPRSVDRDPDTITLLALRDDPHLAAREARRA